MPSHLNLGHIGLLDSAPLLVAQKSGFFADEGLSVTLSCELGLASICGKLADERLDGACVPAPLPVLLSLGSGLARVPMRVVATTSWQGTGVVLAGARGPGRAVAAVARIGVVAPGTSARFILLKLSQASASPLVGEVTQVPIAASQMIDFFQEGMVDGICAGDPLPALACALPGAERVADSGDLFPGHLGGVLALRAERLELQPGLGPAVERAIIRAREVCADPARTEEIWRMVLAQAPYADLTKEARASVLAAAASGMSCHAGTRFAPPENSAGGASAAEVFLENACRGAAAASVRPPDIKAEIAWVYARAGRVELVTKK